MKIYSYSVENDMVGVRWLKINTLLPWYVCGWLEHLHGWHKYVGGVDILPFLETLFNILHFYGTYLPSICQLSTHKHSTPIPAHSRMLRCLLSRSWFSLCIRFASTSAWKHRKFVVSLSRERSERKMRQRDRGKANDSRHTIDFVKFFRMKTLFLTAKRRIWEILLPKKLNSRGKKGKIVYISRSEQANESKQRQRHQPLPTYSHIFYPYSHIYL